MSETTGTTTGAPLTAEQAVFLRDFVLPTIEGEYQATRRVLLAVPDERSDYRPDAKSRTARELAWHIVATELDFLKSIDQGAFGSMEEPPNPTSSMAEMIEFYDREIPAGIARLRQMTAERLAAPISFFNIYNYSAVVYLNFLTSHTIHHRGQLTAYLRAMDSRVPAIYGPSGDEMWGEGGAAAA